MRCTDAIHLMAGYVDHTLPEHSMKAMKQHLQSCQDCHMEYVIWKESSKLFELELDSVTLPENHHSMVDNVMTRLAREDKWTFPISANVFHLPIGLKRWLTTVSILFLLVFGVLMFGTFRSDDTFLVQRGDWKELKTANLILSIDQLKASTTKNDQTLDIRLQIMASIGDPLSFNHGSGYSPSPNTGLVAGFLGIMITVVTMSWLSRT